MFTDIVGYTAQMSKDEAVAISLLNKKESILKPLIKAHNGKYVKGTGDGSLSYFHSATDAAVCSVKLQEVTYNDKDMNIRVGIHIGDIGIVVLRVMDLHCARIDVRFESIVIVI